MRKGVLDIARDEIKITVRLRIIGRVQGVFFRKSTKDKADELGVLGWVRNDRDGTVEIMATGDKEILEKFISWCKKGPPLSKVKNVDIDWLSEVESYENFVII